MWLIYGRYISDAIMKWTPVIKMWLIYGRYISDAIMKWTPCYQNVAYIWGYCGMKRDSVCESPLNKVQN